MIRYTFEGIGFNVFWIFITFTTIFNIYARIFNQSGLYLVGLTGLITIFAANLILGCLFFKRTFYNGYGNHYRQQFIFAMITFPFIVFGILSTFYCYQKQTKQAINRNQSKFLRLDYQQITLCFNTAVFISSFIVFFVFIAVSYLTGYQFIPRYLVLLIPTIPVMFNVLAVWLKNEKFYLGTFLSWNVIGILISLFSIFTILTSRRLRNFLYFIDCLGIILMLAINVIIGLITSFKLYRQKLPKTEEREMDAFENQSFVLIETSEE